MKPSRVLICGFTEGRGGMENYIMNIYRRIDREKLQFDFLNFHTFELAYTEEIKRLGGNIYYVPMKREDIRKHYEELNRVFSQNEYCGVYYQCNHKLVSLDVFQAAKEHMVPKRVVHSHNSTNKKNSFLHRLREKKVELSFQKYVTDQFACSTNAGEWMFGKKSFRVIANGIDTTKFVYHPSKREQIRKQLGITDQLVIGTVGRIVEAKNPEYMVDVFEALYRKNPNAVFLHLGEGHLYDVIKEKIKQKGLDQNYLLLGQQEQVDAYMSAMDVFVLPSKHEGFPFVMVEAQSTGLQCLVADNITKECDLTGNVTYLSNAVHPSVWADTILSLDISKRSDWSQHIYDNGYDVTAVASQIQNYFLGE